MPDDTQARFDALLYAMAHGQSPSSAQKKPSGGQASHEAESACSNDTQTPPDISEDGEH